MLFRNLICHAVIESVPDVPGKHETVGRSHVGNCYLSSSVKTPGCSADSKTVLSSPLGPLASMRAWYTVGKIVI